MKPKISALLVATIVAAQASSAQTASMARATLATPTNLHEPMMINDTVWRCDSTSCIGPAGNGRQGDARACADLARKLGRIVYYQGGGDAFNAVELARCNQRARKTP